MIYDVYAIRGNPNHLLLVDGDWVINGNYKLEDCIFPTKKIGTINGGNDHYNVVIERFMNELRKADNEESTDKKI